MALDFTAYLSTPLDTIEAPKPLPVGHYYAEVKKWEAVESKSEKRTPMVRVDFTIRSADSDVDPAELPKDGVNNRLVSVNYTLNNEYGTYQLRQFMADALKLDIKGLSLQDGLEQIAGQPVKLYIEQRALDDGRLMADVKKTLPVD